MQAIIVVIILVVDLMHSIVMSVIMTLSENLNFDANVKCLHLSLPLLADTHVYVVSQTNEVC